MTTPTPDQFLAASLDAIALVEAILTDDEDAALLLLASSTDVEHWRRVSARLADLLAGGIRTYHDLEDARSVCEGWRQRAIATYQEGR